MLLHTHPPPRQHPASLTHQPLQSPSHQSTPPVSGLYWAAAAAAQTLPSKKKKKNLILKIFSLSRYYHLLALQKFKQNPTGVPDKVGLSATLKRGVTTCWTVAVGNDGLDSDPLALSYWRREKDLFFGWLAGSCWTVVTQTQPVCPRLNLSFTWAVPLGSSCCGSRESISG